MGAVPGAVSLEQCHWPARSSLGLWENPTWCQPDQSPGKESAQALAPSIDESTRTPGQFAAGARNRVCGLGLCWSPSALVLT